MRTQIASLLALAVVAACGSPDASGPAAPSAPSALSTTAPFCTGLALGECLTFVLTVSPPSLETDLGMNAIALALRSTTHASALRTACAEGLAVSLRTLTPNGLDLRSRLFGSVKRSRCLLRASEAEPLPNLEENEVGVSFQMVTFGLADTTISSNPVFGQFTYEGTRMETQFRDPRVFLSAARAWSPVMGKRNLLDPWHYNGIFPTSRVSVPVARGLQFRFDGAATLAYAASKLGPLLDDVRSDGNYGEFVSSLAVFRATLARISAGGAQAAMGSLVLVGLGLDALRDLCKAEGADCRFKRGNQDVVADLDAAFQSGAALPAEGRAHLLDAIKNLPMDHLGALIAGAQRRELVAMFPYVESQGLMDLAPGE